VLPQRTSKESVTRLALGAQVIVAHHAYPIQLMHKVHQLMLMRNEIEVALYMYHKVSFDVPVSLRTLFGNVCSGICLSFVHVREALCDLYIMCQESHGALDNPLVIARSPIIFGDANFRFTF